MVVIDGIDLDTLYVAKVPYNGSGEAGGDPSLDNVNIWYELISSSQSGDVSWMLTATALVLLMIPGVGFFYSGLARRKSALSLIWLSLVSVAVTSVQWFFWGYSLAFSHTAGPFIGDLANFGFRNVLARPSVGSARVPDLLFAVYQGMFAAITVALATGAAVERGRLLPAVVFMFVWATVVYSPIACWTWNPSGWSNRLGGLDFAGGTPVHIAAGCSALAYSLMLGKRRGYGTPELNYRPHNSTHVAIGTVFMWVGWFGFNGGSALAANMRAVSAAMVTNLAACVGGIAWCLVDYRLERKWSLIGFCSGVVTGLVAITPGSGYVPVWSAVVYGVVAAVLSNLSTKAKFLFRADDALDVFAVHAVGGLVGNVLTGIFARADVAGLDGVQLIDGGWLDRHWAQPAYQLADSFAGGAYSFLATGLILFLINLLPGLELRVAEGAEILGIDDSEIGEFAYDYVELRRDVATDVDDGGVGNGGDGDGGGGGVNLGRIMHHHHHHHHHRTDSADARSNSHFADPREKNSIPLTDQPKVKPIYAPSAYSRSDR